jgi:hypothetical protein
MSLYVTVSKSDKPKRLVGRTSAWRRLSIMRECVPFSMSVEFLDRGYSFGIRRESRD